MARLARILACVVALATVVVAPACAGKLDGIVRSQAALDLGCPEDQVQIRDLRSDNYVRDFSVSGCGRQAHYQAACSMVGTCTAYRAGEIAANSLPASDALTVGTDDLQAAPAPTPAEAAAPAVQAEAGTTTMVADAPPAEEPKVEVSESVTSSVVAATPAPAPGPAPTFGPPQTVTLRNDCPRTVTIFVGVKPGEGGGRYMTVGSTNMIGPTLRSGESVWLLDSKQAGLTSVSVAESTREIVIAESCSGLAAR
jgi:hypothetical protein